MTGVHPYKVGALQKKKKITGVLRHLNTQDSLEISIETQTSRQDKHGQAEKKKSAQAMPKKYPREHHPYSPSFVGALKRRPYEKKHSWETLAKAYVRA